MSDRIHRSTRTTLRALYRKTWGQDWPHDDEYLDTLWRETRDETPKSPLGNYRIPNLEMQANCVNAMRENDDTIPPEYGRVQRERVADHIDGFDRDDLGESPDY